MVKKAKLGKQRLDKYYKLAKETGYRSRAAFKLVQLNRKFEFLQRSKVLVDLCAAPGGWLQVASQLMPMSSLIIGVDLVPIRSIPNVITFQDDITKDSCKQSILKELKTWKADCVLHDGSPNVGQNWLQDAFAQAQLTLSAFKLGCDLLRRGGSFVTKVFRSKDYMALVTVFKKLFKYVHVTKPQASRLESAEIYVCCQGYLQPERISPELLDPRSVFKELNLEPDVPKLNIQNPLKIKKKVEGYAEGDYTLYHKVSVMEFVNTEHPVSLLADASEIVLDDERIKSHEETTTEIRACCGDIKVLGRGELRSLLRWRKRMIKFIASVTPKELAPEPEETGPTPEEQEDMDIQIQYDDAKREEKSEAKKKRKKEMKAKRQKKVRLDLKMIHKGDIPDVEREMEIFSLASIEKEKAFLRHTAEELPSSSNIEADSNDEDNGTDHDSGKGSDSESISDIDFGEKLPEDALLDDLDRDTEEVKTKKRAASWFSKEVFEHLTSDDDDDAEIEYMAEQHRKKDLSKDKSEHKRIIIGGNSTSGTALSNEQSNVVTTEENETDEEEVADKFVDGAVEEKEKAEQSKKVKLSAETLSLGEIWMDTAKSRRNLIDSAYNRYMDNDDELPDWFEADEAKHRRKQLPITKEQVAYYKQREREINARPIKKVAEAQGRKRRRAVKKLDRARKKAEAIVDNPDLNAFEKAQEMKRIYKQAAPKKSKDVTYVVSKKGLTGKRAHRPKGVTGRFRVVDPRLKKDKRKARMEAKNAKRRKGKKTAKPSKASK